MTTQALSDRGEIPATDDARITALIGFAHGILHFFHLLPPLFPWLMPEFGLSFIEIGATMTVFFVVSGLGQSMAGFAVLNRHVSQPRLGHAFSVQGLSGNLGWAAARPGSASSS